jgi:transposase
VQGRHAEQTSDALGAAACQIGPNAIALAAHLNKVVGATYAKMAVFFRIAFRFPLAASTLVRAMLRLARKMEPSYQAIRAIVRSSPVVYPDETGWRICGRRAWLWVFVGDRAVLYVIARYRGFSVAQWALGKNFSGFLGHDGWSIYDDFEKAIHQTCLGHLLVRCKNLLETATRRAVSFPRELKAILKDAFALRDRALDGDLQGHGLLIALGRLRARLEELLSMTLTHRGNARLAKHVENHKDELFTFVEHPHLLEGTNAPAEQETRPAVILRKISGCNKTWRGAHAHEVLVSILRTAWHRRVEELQFIVDALRSPTTTAPLPAFLLGSSP